ncbi:MAG TPA: hypothetical protein H9838_05220 [Candidatus Acutalibacter pullistercoris]|uniref:Uncharacterized protein n=1 Tax=Candidatus Acutalibacter pullistercoris TaxID=2838418 RepID=A0A9D2C1L1_9FIRM|nr:hypothetical protein [Candidatus Acutalibacter pullistercoris]
MQSKIHRAPARERVTPVPLGDFDVFEDEEALVNRLYYGVPSYEEGLFRCPIFFEENTFRKEANGDLTLIRSVRKGER